MLHTEVMTRFLINIAISIVTSAVALLVCAWILEGFTFTWTGFLTAVLVFTVAQAVLAPFVFNIARKFASKLLGGVGIVSTLLALWIASLFDGGLKISGAATWILAALIVWIITAFGTWLLPMILIKKKGTRKA